MYNSHIRLFKARVGSQKGCVQLRWLRGVRKVLFVNLSCVNFPGVQKMSVRLSYCWKKTLPKRKCNLGDYVLTMEGESPFPTNVVGDIACQCSQPLVLHATRPDGVYTLQDFSCGKVRKYESI